MDKLEKLISQAKKLKLSNADTDTPEYKAWHNATLCLLERLFGKGSRQLIAFERIEFYSLYGCAYPGTFEEDPVKVKEYFQKGLDTAILYLESYQSDEGPIKKQNQTIVQSVDKKSIFIVHGRNDSIKAQVSNLLLKLDLKPIILHEQANRGKTIIEKFEANANASAAVVLFTDDDVGKYKEDEVLEARARQNVIFEAGYFIGKFGRERTIILNSPNINIPSDLQGYVYIELDAKQRWHYDLAKELKGIGFEVDLNKLI